MRLTEPTLDSAGVLTGALKVREAGGEDRILRS